ncbi:cationic amino acid transporter 2, vacuolar-like protein [Tanacetum coccineum]
MSSPGAPSAGPSTPPSYSSGPSTPPKLFFKTIEHTYKLFSRILINGRDAQTVKHFAWKYKCTQGNNGNAYASGTTHSESRKCISQLLCVHEENAQMRRCPSDGSAYHYSYICVGEGLAWIIGWALILEYTIRGSTVTYGISPNLALLFGGPDSLPFFLARHTIPGLGIVVDPFPAVLVFTVTRLLCVGVKEGTIAHALENTKYEVSYMKWKELDPKYHFSCQFTSDTSIFHHHMYFPRDCWKNKLQNPAGQHSDVPENLIPTVRKRVDVLREIQIGDITLDVRLTSYRE